ncbi:MULTISPECIES: NfeD family protein [unclassified Aureimonas]|uniref:NfeD family protein n=1 Tax=unclassified Aureimonas TaxID=2615206 RepID=UPI0006F7CA59|nr:MULTISPECIES: NfeD family protein [unclassified Aureimonas]KQT52122.1 hypothetical protein ASG62_15775 [Aureimonas sp. Leaf427]KQT70644.1 hypothetical protein ASG54_22175 [Aureimonas sp. Leaf460]
MIDLLGNYGWWILGLVFLILEIVAPGVYFLFLGIAAIVVGTNVVLLGSAGWFGWEQQIVAFIVVSAVAVLIGRLWYGSRDEAASPTLKTGTERLVGRVATVREPIAAGRGRVAIDDSWWTAEGPDLPEGARVRIVGANGSTLIVEAAASSRTKTPQP